MAALRGSSSASIALSLHGDASQPPGSLDGIASRLADHPGLRARVTGDVVRVLASVGRIERVGPAVEAVAAVHGLSLRLEALDAIVRPSELTGRPSPVWAAIGDGALATELERFRGEEPRGDTFRYLRVEEVGGSRIATDARPPRVRGGASPPPDLGPTKYDDADWHEESAIEAGAAPEASLVHIGLYLSWLIRHDLHRRGAFAPRVVKALRTGQVGAAELAGYCDGKLVSDLMSSRGVEFSDECYEAYLRGYDELFETAGTYALADSPQTQALVDALLDRLYREWANASRHDPAT